MGQTEWTNGSRENLRFPAVSAKCCASEVLQFPGKANICKKSAKICKHLRIRFGLSHLVCPKGGFVDSVCLDKRVALPQSPLSVLMTTCSKSGLAEKRLQWHPKDILMMADGHNRYHPGRNYYKTIPRNIFCNDFVILFLNKEKCFCNSHTINSS